jgi:hypothetical protein
MLDIIERNVQFQQRVTYWEVCLPNNNIAARTCRQEHHWQKSSADVHIISQGVRIVHRLH